MLTVCQRVITYVFPAFLFLGICFATAAQAQVSLSNKDKENSSVRNATNERSVGSFNASKVEGLDVLTSAFEACFPQNDLSARNGERFVIKGKLKFDRPPKDFEASIGEPVPAGLRGAIRRVMVTDGRKLVALTLDMCEQRGEISGYDGDIFDYLRENKIKATVFAGGKWMRSHVVRTKQLMVDPLFEIANHAEAHRNLRGLSGKRLMREILGPQKAYENIRLALQKNMCLAKYPEALPLLPPRLGLFRFPFGACNKRSLDAVNDAGLLAIQWDVSTGDPTPSMSAQAISRQILRNVKPGSIVIAHANGRGVHTAKGLPLAVSELLRRGYEFVTVSELLAAGRPVITTTCYNSRPGDTDQYDRFIAGRKHKRSAGSGR